MQKKKQDVSKYMPPFYSLLILIAIKSSLKIQKKKKKQNVFKNWLQKTFNISLLGYSM